MGPLVLIIPNKTSFQSTFLNRSMCQIGTTEGKMSPNDDNHQHTDELIHRNNDIKYFVDLYTAALHLRQRMKEEKLIHSSYSAYFNDENNNNNTNNFYSIFHNCFHSYEIVDWLIKKQLCKTIHDGVEIFQVLEKLKIIHHVCDLNEFEYPACPSAHNNFKYLYRFRLDDGTADENRSFQQFASIYETYTSLFTLDKNQCRGIDLQQTTLSNPYDEQSGIVLKGDNLARMLALRSNTNIERLVDNMIQYGLVRFDLCDQSNDCNCSQKFRSDEYHQYILSNAHRLLPKQRLDLVALMNNKTSKIRQSYSHENLRTSLSDSSMLNDDIVMIGDDYRRKKSSSLNSPVNSDHRPTADELEKRESPWRCRSYTVKRDRRGYGLILQGQGPSYVDRLDPYGSAFHSGIRLNEYIYAIEGVNVLRRSGKEIERLLSMFDKCTIYTIYNRDDFSQISTPPNECHTKTDLYSLKSHSTTFSDYSNTDFQSTSNYNHLTNPILDHQQTSISYSTSPSSSIDGCSSCSISPKHLQQSTNNRKGVLTKHFQFFRLTSRSYSNALK